MKRKILITGAGGYIGSVTTYLFLRKGYKVVALDNFSTGYKKPLELLHHKFPQNFSFYQKNLLSENLDEIFKEEDIDTVIHFAASCLVNESVEHPEKYFTNNVCGSQNLLANMQKYGVSNFVFSSTCAVYGKAHKIPITEAHPTNPSNPYGESKLMIEKMIKWYGELKGLNYVILRYFNVCGASTDGIIGDSKKPSVLLVQNAVRGALGIEPFYFTSPKFDTPDGSSIRDYINVEDLADAHLRAYGFLKNKTSKETIREIINLGTGKGSSVLEIINSVQRITGKRFDINKSDPRKGEDPRLIADIKKAKKVLGWKPVRTIENSVRSLIKWYENHPKGWD